MNTEDQDKSFLGTLRALPEGRRLLAYLALCLALSLLVTFSNRMEQQGAASLGIYARIVAGALALSMAGRASRIPLRHKKSLPWIILLGLVPPLVFLLFRMGPVSLAPSGGAVIRALVSIVTTAYWEETLFRLWGRLLFEEEGGYKARNFLSLAVIFGCMHLGNLLNGDAGATLLQVVFAVLAGLFLQTLYTWTGSLTLVMLTHIWINAAEMLPTLWVPASERYLAARGGLEIILVALFFALSAGILTRRGGLIRRGRPLLKLGKKRGKML